MSNIVSLMSGGVDSSLMVKILKDEGINQNMLYVDLGHPAADQEWKSCRTIARYFDLTEPMRVDFRNYSKVLGQFGFDFNKVALERYLYPGRNLMLLWVASFVAFANEYNGVAIGLNRPGFPHFPDQIPEFIVNTEYAVSSAFGSKISIKAPLIELDKTEIIHIAVKNGVPLDLTYSCQIGEETYCGNCISCVDIKNTGFEKLFGRFGQEGYE